jgi:uncharacterized protein
MSRKIKPGLLDSNVLLALAWPTHQHHRVAHRWFAEEASFGWATCAMTQLGFIRLSSNPSFSPDAVLPVQAASLLGRYCSHECHRFWESPSAYDMAIFQRALGHKQVNDAWLVAAAVHHKGRVITFDKKLAVHGTTSGTVYVIEP